MIVYILLASVINFSTASDVIELNDAEFQSRLTQYETTLVMFYAPW